MSNVIASPEMLEEAFDKLQRTWSEFVEANNSFEELSGAPWNEEIDILYVDNYQDYKQRLADLRIDDLSEKAFNTAQATQDAHWRALRVLEKLFNTVIDEDINFWNFRNYEEFKAYILADS